MLETGTFSGTDFAGDMSSKSRTVPENRGRMVTLARRAIALQRSQNI